MSMDIDKEKLRAKIKKLSPQPGDLFLVKVDDAETLEEWENTLREIIGNDINALIYVDGTSRFKLLHTPLELISQ